MTTRPTDPLYKKQGRRYVPAESPFSAFDGFMVVSAVRYCHGRASYAPSVAMDWCRDNWHHLSDEGLVTVLPAVFDAWQQGQGRVVSVARPGETPVARAITRARGAARGPATFAITSPPDGATYLIDPTLRREFQTLPLRAVGAASALSWTVSGRAVGTADAGATIEWPLAPGRHQVVVTDARGRTAAATITVR